MTTVLVRRETEADWPAVRAVNCAAFGTSVEADIVDALRREASPLISLVAEVDGALIGHIMFSPVSLEGHETLSLMGLAPMAVAPAQQRSGIGSALVIEGLAQCRQLGCRAVVVLGHPGYYPRFGFAPAASHGIRAEWPVPDDVFMVVELEPGALRGATGVIRYHALFANAE
jgi:putative acetyltransferase